MMNFLVLEGLDGSGKSTQVCLLKDYFEKLNIKYQYLHFPRTESGIFGELVSRFLRGDYGKLEHVHPQLVALLYAGDRNDARMLINSWIEAGYLVLIDRYVNSNIAFQCAKLTVQQEKDQLKCWIQNLEYEYYAIPKPDLSIFLDVPFNFTSKSLKNNRSGIDREYLEGKQDIHEANLNFQEMVRQEYLAIERENENFKLINCTSPNAEMLAPEIIHARVVQLIEEFFCPIS